jgi:hypothetical protein
VLDLAFLARPHIGGERLAAVLDHASQVLGEQLDVHQADLDRCRCNVVLHAHPAVPWMKRSAGWRQHAVCPWQAFNV